ncbi:MAG: hypothetical protein ACK4N5_04470, partial [Myxococcales bacterium]
MIEHLSPLARQTFARLVPVLRRPVVAFAALAAAVGGALLTRLPLFELPGYELAAAMTLLLALLCGTLGILLARQERRFVTSGGPAGWQQRPTGAGAVGLCAAGAAATGLGVLVLPFLAAIVGAGTTSRCDPFTGIGFYALLPVPTAVLAAFAGTLVGFATRRAWAAAVLYAALLLASLAVSLAPIWTGPQIFALNHFLGYFPGPLYDEALEVDGRLFAFRALTAAWTLLLFTVGAAFVDPASARLVRRTPNGRHVAAALALVPAVLFFWFYDFPLGLQTRHDDLARELGGQSETAHFVLHYPRTKPVEDVRRLERDLEFKYAQVTAFFGIEYPRKIHAWFHKSAEDKRRLVGAAHTNFAKPWRSQWWNPTMICWGLGAFGLGLTGVLEVNTKEDLGAHAAL